MWGSPEVSRSILHFQGRHIVGVLLFASGLRQWDKNGLIIFVFLKGPSMKTQPNTDWDSAVRMTTAWTQLIGGRGTTQLETKHSWVFPHQSFMAPERTTLLNTLFRHKKGSSWGRIVEIPRPTDTEAAVSDEKRGDLLYDSSPSRKPLAPWNRWSKF